MSDRMMTGAEALDHGFADSTTPPLKMAASVQHDLSHFRNPPKPEGATAPGNKQDITMPEPMPAPAPVAPTAPAPAIDLSAAIAALTLKIDALSTKPAPIPPGVAPIALGVSDVGNATIEQYNKMVAGAARNQFRIANHAGLVAARKEHGFAPQANDLAAGLVNDYLSDALIVSWTEKLAMVDKFTLAVQAAPMAPRRSIDIAWAQGTGSGMLTNATNFEIGSTTLAVATITMNQYSFPFTLTNAELQQGHEISRIAAINAEGFADGLHDLITAEMVVATFATSIAVGTAVSMAASKLPPILAAAKNFKKKILLMDGGHLAYLLPTTTQNFALNSLPNGGYGFDSILENNSWTGATATAVGFICGPDALVIATALPLQANNNVLLGTGGTTLKNGIGVQHYSWFNSSGRALWNSYDIIFGVEPGNTGAGRCLTTT